MTNRAGDLGGQLDAVQRELQVAEQHHAAHQQQVDDHEQVVDRLTGQLHELRTAREQLQARYLQQVRTAADLDNQMSADHAQLASAQTAAERRREALQQLAAHQLRSQAELQALEQKQTQLAQQAQQQALALEQAQTNLDQHRRELSQRRQQWGQLNARCARCRERAEVLHELEAHLEGVHDGVRQVLARVHSGAAGPLDGVCGLVADLIQAGVDTAAMIDVALGERSQHLVVTGTTLLDYLQSSACKLPGRIGFVWLDCPLPTGEAYQASLAGKAGVMGRADAFVETPALYQALVRWLLGSTWLVETLADALRLRQEAPPGIRFVTRAGQLLDSDGRILAGSAPASVGLVSRRSQLRAARDEMERLGHELDQLQQDCDGLSRSVETQEPQVHQLRAAHQQTSAELAQQAHNGRPRHNGGRTFCNSRTPPKPKCARPNSSSSRPRSDSSPPAASGNSSNCP